MKQYYSSLVSNSVAIIVFNLLFFCRLEEVNVSWCDFSSVHVQAISSNILSSVTQLNISGYRQNLTIEGEESIDFKSLCFFWIPV